MKNQNNDVYVVAFDSAGYSSTITICDETIADSCARQLRRGGRKVRKMDYITYCNMLEREYAERSSNRRFYDIRL